MSSKIGSRKKLILLFSPYLELEVLQFKFSNKTALGKETINGVALGANKFLYGAIEEAA